jgi:hypothetical protein
MSFQNHWEKCRCEAIKMHARWSNWSKCNSLGRWQWHDQYKDQESGKELFGLLEWIPVSQSHPESIISL